MLKLIVATAIALTPLASPAIAAPPPDPAKELESFAWEGCAATFPRRMSVARFTDWFWPRLLRAQKYEAPPFDVKSAEVRRNQAEGTFTARIVTAGGRIARTAQYTPGHGCRVIADTTIDKVLTPLDDAPHPARCPAGLPQGDECPWPYGDARPALPIADRPFAQQVQSIVEATVRDDVTVAALVVQHGRIIAEAYAPGFDYRSRWLTASASKSLVASLAGRLVQERLFSIDEALPMHELAPLTSARPPLLASHMLRQASGLTCVGDDAEAEDDPAGMVSYYAAHSTRYAAPGAAWTYRHSCNHSLVLAALTRIAGQARPGQSFPQRELFDLIGMRDTLAQYADRTGATLGGAGFATSARDLARLGQLYLQDGRWNDTQLLPPGWAAQVATPTIAPANDGGGGPARRYCDDYGMSFWVVNPADRSCSWWPSLPAGSFMMSGSYHQFAAIIPASDMVIVRLGFTGPDPDKLFREVLAQLPADAPR